MSCAIVVKMEVNMYGYTISYKSGLNMAVTCITRGGIEDCHRIDVMTKTDRIASISEIEEA